MSWNPKLWPKMDASSKIWTSNPKGRCSCNQIKLKVARFNLWMSPLWTMWNRPIAPVEWSYRKQLLKESLMRLPLTTKPRLRKWRNSGHFSRLSFWRRGSLYFRRKNGSNFTLRKKKLTKSFLISSFRSKKKKISWIL